MVFRQEQSHIIKHQYMSHPFLGNPFERCNPVPKMLNDIGTLSNPINKILCVKYLEESGNSPRSDQARKTGKLHTLPNQEGVNFLLQLPNRERCGRLHSYSCFHWGR